MSDRSPRHDPIDELGRELLRSARLDGHRAPDRVRTRILLVTSALASGVGASSAAASTMAAGTAATAVSGSTAAGAAVGTGLVGGIVAKWVVIGASAAVVTVGGVHAVRFHSGAVQAPAAAAEECVASPVSAQASRFGTIAAEAEVERMDPSPARSADALGSVSVATTHPAPIMSTSKTTHRASRTRGAAADPPAAAERLREAHLPADTDIPADNLTPSLLPEIAALDSARAALAAGDTAGALRALQLYDRNHPAGALRAEASFVRIQATWRSGNIMLARQLATSFFAEYPNSPQAPVVRSLISTPNSSAP